MALPELETVLWLHQQKLIGLYRGHITFAMRNEAGDMVGIHRWFEAEGKLKFLGHVDLLVIGDPATATECDIHESTWDLIAELDRTGWHHDPAKLFFVHSGRRQREISQRPDPAKYRQDLPLDAER